MYGLWCENTRTVTTRVFWKPSILCSYSIVISVLPCCVQMLGRHRDALRTSQYYLKRAPSSIMPNLGVAS